jgi:hypothetical protein
MNTPADGFRSATSVNTLYDIIDRNKELMQAVVKNDDLTED